MKDTKSPPATPANDDGVAPAQSLGAWVSPAQDSDQSREQLIALTAYFRAERRGFAPGDDLADWFQAEADLKNRASPTTG